MDLTEKEKKRLDKSYIFLMQWALHLLHDIRFQHIRKLTINFIFIENFIIPSKTIMLQQ